jgi:Holliday junction resolvasome RuvABC endonuclease subunit
MKCPGKLLALDVATVMGFFHTPSASGVVKLTGDIEEKMATLADWLRRTVKTLSIDLIAYEEASYGASGRRGEGGVQWSTIVFHNQMRGIVRLTARELGIECKAVHLSTAKAMATGNGRASKEQVKRAFKTFLGKEPIDDNHADAWAIFVAAEQGAFMVKKAKKPRVPKKAAAPRVGQQRMF